MISKTVVFMHKIMSYSTCCKWFVNCLISQCFHISVQNPLIVKLLNRVKSIYFIIPREAEGYSVELFGLSVRLAHPWRGPLRHVCGHTNHRATMIRTYFWKTPSSLDVHPRVRFLIFQKLSPELASKSTLYGYVLLTKGSIALRLMAYY